MNQTNFPNLPDAGLPDFKDRRDTFNKIGRRDTIPSKQPLAEAINRAESGSRSERCNCY
jgi:hypothetical protein